ncbi:MAG TPA: hypothetical protein V6D05_06725 [Stenomitos sp.]
MKLALGFVCLLLMWVGMFDLAPYRFRREGRIQPMRRRTAPQRGKVARR